MSCHLWLELCEPYLSADEELLGEGQREPEEVRQGEAPQVVEQDVPQTGFLLETDVGDQEHALEVVLGAELVHVRVRQRGDADPVALRSVPGHGEVVPATEHRGKFLQHFSTAQITHENILFT